MISEEATLERNVEPDFEVDNKLDPRVRNVTHIGNRKDHQLDPYSVP